MVVGVDDERAQPQGVHYGDFFGGYARLKVQGIGYICLANPSKYRHNYDDVSNKNEVEDRRH